MAVAVDAAEAPANADVLDPATAGADDAAAWRVLDHLVRQHLPRWLDLAVAGAELAGPAAALRALAPIQAGTSAQAALPVLRDVWAAVEPIAAVAAGDAETAQRALWPPVEAQVTLAADRAAGLADFDVLASAGADRADREAQAAAVAVAAAAGATERAAEAMLLARRAVGAVYAARAQTPQDAAPAAAAEGAVGALLPAVRAAVGRAVVGAAVAAGGEAVAGVVASRAQGAAGAQFALRGTRRLDQGPARAALRAALLADAEGHAALLDGLRAATAALEAPGSTRPT